MRIQRLARENQSMQGPAKRAWYQRNSPTHLEAIRTLILEALTRQGPGQLARVAILGAGACTELPLEEIARQAEEVVLVDLDEFALQQARRQLPGQLQGRARLVIADITGGVSQNLEQKLMAQRWQALLAQGQAAVLEAAARCLERCEVPQPPELAELRPGRCNFVISSLVVTQLWSYPLLDLTDLFNTLHPALAGQQHQHPAPGPTIERFKERIAQGHLLLLARLLRPMGTAVLIAEDEGRLVPQTGQEAQHLDAPLPLLPINFSQLVEGVFSPVSAPRGWEWISDLPSAVRPGRTYHVTGWVLAPK
ncbi:MAG TPA: hypothetical protein VH540_02945 [Ktedonobacterales bacterium]|jgi:hypothetical protein